MKFEDYVETGDRIAAKMAELDQREAQLVAERAELERAQYELRHNWQQCEQLRIVPAFRSVEYYKGPDLSKEIVEERKGGKQCYLDSYHAHIVDPDNIEKGFIYLGEARPSQYGDLAESVVNLIAKGVYHAWEYHTTLARNAVNGKDPIQLELPIPREDLLNLYRTIVKTRNMLEVGRIGDHTRGELATGLTDILPMLGRLVGRLGNFGENGENG